MKKLNLKIALAVMMLSVTFASSNLNGQKIGSGSTANHSYFMCTYPGSPKFTGAFSDWYTGWFYSPSPEGIFGSGNVNMVAVSGGASHSLCLRNDGFVFAFGYNLSGQLGIGTNSPWFNFDQVHGPGNIGYLTNVTAIAAGGNHSLFLRSDSTVWATGDNLLGELGDGSNTDRYAVVQVSNMTGIKAIATGAHHSLFLKSDGTVWATGQNNKGQLGDSSYTDRNIPVKVKGLTGIIAIAAGWSHSLFLKSDGSVWSCGDNVSGQLGDNSFNLRNKPVQIKGPGNVGFLSGITSIAAGGFHSLFLKNDSTVFSCGENIWGQLGDSAFINKKVPVQVKKLTSCVAMAAGQNHSVFQKNNGTFWACGDNRDGQLGEDVYDYYSHRTNIIVQVTDGIILTPSITGGTVFNGVGTLHTGDYSTYQWSTGSSIYFTGVTSTDNYSVIVADAWGCSGTATQKTIVNAQHIASGSASNASYFMCSTPGAPRASGANQDGQIGGTDTARTTPATVSGINNVISMAGGAKHSLFLKSDNTVWGTGNNVFGQLGDSTNVNTNTPVEVWGLTGATAIATGSDHSLFLKSNGTVRSVGRNQKGQLGNGTTIDRNLTFLVNNVSSIVAIAAGANHSLFLKNDGTVWACGDNAYGQLGDGTDTTRTNPVNVRISGGYYSWYKINLTGVVAIAAGKNHSVFLKNDGTVWACGYNQQGQLGDGSTINRFLPVKVSGLTGIIAIAAGSDHSLFMKSDSTVWSCGLNTVGQLGDNSLINRTNPVKVSTLTGVSAIAGGVDHSLFLKYDGTVWSTGLNNLGQLGDTTNVNKKKAVAVMLQPSTPVISATLNPVCKNSATTLSLSSANLRGATKWKWYTGGCGTTLLDSGTTITVSVGSNTKYYVRAEGGCQGPSACVNLQININALPVLTVTPAVDTLCPPTANKLFTVVGANTYNWYPPNGLNQTTGSAVLASPTATTVYTVIGTDGNGCSSSKTGKLVVKPVPGNLTTTNITATSAVANWSYISCATGYTLQYRIKNAATWTTLQINSNTNSVPAAGLIPNTNYQWKVKTKFSSGTSAYSITKTFKTLAVRLGEVVADDGFNLYPNPTTGMVTISMSDCIDCNYQLNVYDILGNLVFADQNKADGQNKTIDLSQLAKGIYQVKVQYEGITKNMKLVIE